MIILGKWYNNSICSIDETPRVLSGPENDGKEGVFYTPQIIKPGLSPSDAI